MPLKVKQLKRKKIGNTVLLTAIYSIFVMFDLHFEVDMKGG